MIAPTSSARTVRGSWLTPEQLAKLNAGKLSERVLPCFFMKNFLSLAYPICLEIPRQKKHVSLVVHKGRVISVGKNIFKTHPKAKEIGYLFEEMHSEFDAFRKIPKSLRSSKLTLINVRYNQLGDIRMSRPCELCLPWCKEIFDEIYYTTNEGIVRLEY